MAANFVQKIVLGMHKTSGDQLCMIFLETPDP